MAGRLKEKGTNIKIRTSDFGLRSLIPQSAIRSPHFCCLLAAACCLLLVSCGTPYGIYHRVEKGQTFYSIAKAYNVSPQELMRINRIKEPADLKEGDAVFVPRASIEKVVEAHKDDVYTPPAKARGKPPIEAPRRDASATTSKTEKGRVIWPVDGRLISEFGMRNGERHAGIDIKAEEGAQVKAAESGKVIYSGDGLNGYGNLIIIKHEGTYFTVYAHNRKNIATEGDIVEKSDVIAEVGDTGRATTPHLHFEIRKNKTVVDPIFYLPDKGSLVYK